MTGCTGNAGQPARLASKFAYRLGRKWKTIGWTGTTLPAKESDVPFENGSETCRARSIAQGSKMVNYKAYWKSKSSPFAQRYSSQHFFSGGPVEEAIARAIFLVENRQQLGWLRGGPGVGKSWLLRHLVGRLNSSFAARNAQIAIVSAIGAKEGDIYRLIAEQWGLSVSSKSPYHDSAWQSLDDGLRCAISEGTHSVVLVDDLIYASQSVQSDIHRLLSSERALTVIVSGPVESADWPNGLIPPFLTQRCQLCIDLPPWDLDQTEQFIRFSLNRSGISQHAFDDSAIVRLHELTDGVPRQLQKLADLCLVAGAAAKLHTIPPQLVEQVIDEIPGVGQQAAA